MKALFAIFMLAGLCACTTVPGEQLSDAQHRQAKAMAAGMDTMTPLAKLEQMQDENKRKSELEQDRLRARQKQGESL